jgi:prepilin-type N-terminal cleavage/methylation domain-containing protein
MGAGCEYKRRDGFTLIELSIVLVIIGLIVGGILVGQSLIAAAGVRAQVTQIEKYNTAANTFREKYGYLPGDMPAGPAAQFGFNAARNSCPGQGDGNGLVEGSSGSSGSCSAESGNEYEGETLMFWVDLSTARLIDGGFNTATPNQQYISTLTSTPSLSAYFPAAKNGRGNYIYVYSGGNLSGPNGFNYFGLSAITASGPNFLSTPALSVQEAYSIDTKVDDGLPQTGRVTAQYLGWGGSPGYYNTGAPNGAGVGYNSSPYTGPTAGSSTSCYDNSIAASGTPGVNGATQHYSIEMSNGANVTCALSFQMQAGD